MDDDDDYAYFCRRADTELEQAQHAADPTAAAAHYQLAEAYRQRASSLASDDVTGAGVS